MSIAASDIIAYASLDRPEDEVSTAGGGIDVDTRVVFTDLAANDSVEVLSSNAGDTTPQITVYGRKPTGVYANETVTLNGVTPVPLSTLGTLERIEKAVLDSDCLGIVTVRRSSGGSTIQTIPVGERGFTRLFIGAFSEASPKAYYAKFFWKNAHATLSLLSSVVKQSADPAGVITHALADTIDDTDQIADRLTAPTDITEAFSDGDKAVVGDDLAAGTAQGVWLKMSLAGNNAAIKNTYTSEIDGNSV